jgi:hypothetical protein
MTIRLKIITLLQRIPTGWRLRPNKEMYFIYDYNKKIRNVDVFIFSVVLPPTCKKVAFLSCRFYCCLSAKETTLV